jgi:hypothetical protein
VKPGKKKKKKTAGLVLISAQGLFSTSVAGSKADCVFPYIRDRAFVEKQVRQRSPSA